MYCEAEEVELDALLVVLCVLVVFPLVELLLAPEVLCLFAADAGFAVCVFDEEDVVEAFGALPSMPVSFKRPISPTPLCRYRQSTDSRRRRYAT